MRRFIHLAYNGAGYSGWQVQPGQPTVQGAIEDALATLLRRPVPIVGAGRTDAGVNAHMMMAHFDVLNGEDVDSPRFIRSLNSILGPSIAIYNMLAVPDDAHARFDATERTYRYFAHTAKDPFIGPLSWQTKPDIDFDAMNEAAALILGRRDFTSFSKLHTDVKTNICDLRAALWKQFEPDRWYFEISADRFLRNMVRAVVGTLVEVGRHKIPPQAILDILASKNRCAAGTSMPAQPLFLWNIKYDYLNSLLTMDQLIPTTNEIQYDEILQHAVAVIESARDKAARAIVGASNEMHWEIGKLLYERKLDSMHGDGVVKRLSSDLKMAFPKMGMSVSSLWDMKRFYVRFMDASPKLRQAVGVLPWWNINKLIAKLGNDDEAILFYAEQTIAKRWNRDLMVNAINMELHKHLTHNNITNNFITTLPEIQATYANEVFKDTYSMGFLGFTEPILELELERRLVEKIKQFLLDLGQGFTYIGNQHSLSYNGKEYKVDMLFFHRGLKALVAIDLKISEFKPEYIGKMNLYLSLLDRLEKGADENPSIGIILCAEKDNVEVELALDGFHKPIGVAEYRLILPQKELKQLITDEIHSFNREIKAKT